MTQLIEHLSLDFGLGHDSGVMGSNPVWAYTLSVEPD